VNNRKQAPGDELHELAALHALGSLEERDSAAFEEHLRQGCDTCASDVRSFEMIASLIGESLPAAAPPRLRERLLSKIGDSPRVPGIVLKHSGLLIARSEELAWQPIASGVFLKPLYEDKARKSDTSLVRMDAGAHIPSHHHAGIEELFLLSGDLHVEGQVMRAGDYCRADFGSTHGETFTDGGCLFLLMASPENRVAESRSI
jgi:quercetin dioxygenase-like cupin family protein